LKVGEGGKSAQMRLKMKGTVIGGIFFFGGILVIIGITISAAIYVM